ncbi:MAG: hydrogenase subunit MbhD domain-containing protein [Phycisphaerales bacterium]
MTVALAVDIGLVVLTLAVATWTINARETYAAVVGFVACGLLLTLVWMRLAAPDVAMTEAAIGSGLSGMLLLGAASRLRATEPAAGVERPGAAHRLAAGALCAAVTAGLAAVVLSLPAPPPTLAPEATSNLPRIGLGNPVTAVLLAYRALDTLLEKVVLLLALLGVWSLAPDQLWGGRARVWRVADGPPSGPLTLLAQVLPPFGLIVGVYLFWNGANAPGGTFPAGTILAAMWLLVLVAGSAKVPSVGRRWLRLVMVAGPMLFIVVALAGFAAAGAFLGYPEAYAKPLIVAIETVLTLSIAATLAMMVAGRPQEPREQVQP